MGFRQADPRLPFFWEATDQPAGRWHGSGEGPCQYIADTPDGAWAEFLRHEEITEPADLAGIRRRLWTVELPADIDAAVEPRLPARVLRGGRDSYARCQAFARATRDAGATVIRAPSAALVRGAARGQVVDDGLRPGPAAEGIVWAVFGPRPSLRGWACVDAGTPETSLLASVRHLTA